MLLAIVGAPASAQLCADTSPLASFQGVAFPGVLYASDAMVVHPAMANRLYSLDPATLASLGSQSLPDSVVATTRAS